MSKVFSYGQVEVTVAASSRIAVYSDSAVKVYQKVGYPNYPDSYDLLATTTAGDQYLSSTFSAATTVKLEAGASDVFYETGTSPNAGQSSILSYSSGDIGAGADFALTSLGVAGTAESVTQTDDVNLYQNNISLTPGGTDKEFKLFRNQVTTAAADTDAGLKLSYDRIDLDHKLKEVYLHQDRLDIGANGDLVQAGYGSSLSITLANTGALDSDLFGQYVICSGAGAGGITGNFNLYQGVANATANVDAIFGADAAASGTATTAYRHGGAGTTTNLLETQAAGNLTNFLTADAVDGPFVANALVPAAAPDATTVGADIAIKFVVNSTTYYLAGYNTLHA